MKNKKTIRINDTGPSYCWNPSSTFRFIYEFLQRNFTVEISDHPDYLICNGGSFEDLKWRDCVKICFTVENILPDFNRYDYVIGSDYVDFGDRYLRMPLFVAYNAYKKLECRAKDMPTDQELLNRKFCSYVVSNANGDPIREYFYHQLSKYKRIDSGGRFMNNIGGPVENKYDFCRQYKFNIAFENSSLPGYVTEKIMEPYSVHSLPIYWGAKRIGEDFNLSSMVLVKNREDVDRAINEIITLDKDDASYLAKCKAECLARPYSYFFEKREKFLVNIFSQPLDEAKRLTTFGNQEWYRTTIGKMVRLDDAFRSPVRRVKRIISKFF